MDRVLKYLESRVESIKISISKAEDRLVDANRAETERIGRMGWGYGMRHSKLNFSTSKSDRIKERISNLKVTLDKIQRTIEFVKSINTTMSKKRFYDVPTKFVFSGTFRIKAESQEQAEEYVQKHCGLVIGEEIHSSLPDGDVDWMFNSHPEKIIGNERD